LRNVRESPRAGNLFFFYNSTSLVQTEKLQRKFFLCFLVFTKRREEKYLFLFFGSNKEKSRRKSLLYTEREREKALEALREKELQKV
jgi:hypothetical protein